MFNIPVPIYKSTFVWNVQDGLCRTVAGLLGARIRTWVTQWWNWFLWSKILFRYTSRFGCSHILFNGCSWLEGRSRFHGMAVAVAFKILFSCHRASKANKGASISFSCSSRCLSSLLSSCNNFSSTVLEYSLIMLLKSLFKQIFCFLIPTKDAVLRLWKVKTLYDGFLK